VSRYGYYQELKTLARDVRARHSLTSPRVLRSDMRRIYRTEGIRIDLWRHRLRGLRGAYFNDEFGPTVMVASGLPSEPMIFTLGHELKHHLVDRDSGGGFCSESNRDDAIEIGAEIFAAELIFPEEDFCKQMVVMGVEQGQCTAETIVRLKHETTTTMSHAALAKRAEYLRFAPEGSLQAVKWTKLTEKLYGEPLYKLLIRSRGRRRR
jgi:Zn-dependent peptidase ImmA (M78 family)